MSQELQKQTESANSLIQSKGQSRLLGDWIKNEAEYEIALTYAEKRIGEYNKEDMPRLVEVMAKWRLLLGVTSESSDQELIVICQFVYDNFKRFTLSDIKLAMNWSISGKTDVGFVSQKIISSFYVSRALNAYEDRKRMMVNEIMENRERHLAYKQIQNPIPPTPAQQAESFKEMLTSLYSAHKNGGLFYDIGDFVYNWMKMVGLINPTPAEIQSALRYAEDKYKSTKKTEAIGSVIAESLKSGNREEVIKKFAREFVIMQKFEQMTLGELISKIKIEQFKTK